MDSLTQIVLGAAVGEAVLGKKVGNRAMFYGAIAGTIPDLDVLARYFTDTLTATEWHRGFSHSIFFSVVFAPIFGWIVWKLNKKQKATYREWSLLMFLGLFTHPILDVFTTWGTQLFWPFETRLAFQNIFVIDPIYTLPFLILLILAALQKRNTPQRFKYNRLGLLLSTGYLFLTLILKGVSYVKFTNSLSRQGIAYKDISTRPTAFNAILWTANVDTDDAYLIGDYSFFDSKEITFTTYRKNHGLLGNWETNDKINRLKKITQNWYTITKRENQLYFNDLRFGLMSLDPRETQFAFSYELIPAKNGLAIVEAPKKMSDAQGLFSALWDRIWGN